MAANKTGRGRPTVYNPDYVPQVEKFCRLGATNPEIADFLGVSGQTINVWSNKYPDFADAIKRGKALADANVADALYRRATGWQHEAVKIFADPKTGSEMQVKYIEHYPPDTVACIFWLKNRAPDRWKDKRNTEISGPNGGSIKQDVAMSPADAYLALAGTKP